jgi:hypothetical protein
VSPAEASELLEVVANGDAKLADVDASAASTTATVVVALIRTLALIAYARH